LETGDFSKRWWRFEQALQLSFSLSQFLPLRTQKRQWERVDEDVFDLSFGT